MVILNDKSEYVKADIEKPLRRGVTEGISNGNKIGVEFRDNRLFEPFPEYLQLRRILS